MAGGVEIQEKDESGKLVATYVASESKNGRGRVDVIVSL